MNYVTIQSYTVDVLLVYGVLRESIQEQTVNQLRAFSCDVEQPLTR